ncbi:MAG: alpha-L-fucosidase, partial [Armatimonadota bacterium]|nr:alpha-L-fucosidase [Armatimonadota bacterium]
NDTWGYKSYDHNWKSTRTLLHLLVDLASKGVNYLPNVGPTAEGEIPAPSVERLREIGRWMRVNGEAIYGTSASPFPSEFDWGRITQKPGRLFLHFYQWPAGEFRLLGLRTPVKAASLLASGAPVAVAQRHDAQLDQHVLEMALPSEPPDPHVSVAVLELGGAVEVDPLPLQQPDGKVRLPAYLATLQSADPDRPLRVGRAGSLENWVHTGNRATWSFKAWQPGTFRTVVVTGHPRNQPWKGGHQVRVELARTALGEGAAGVNGTAQTLRGALDAGEPVQGPRVQYHPEMASALGTLVLDQPGTYVLTLSVEALNPEAAGGFPLAAVELLPA